MAPPPATPNPHRFSTSAQPPSSRAHPTPQTRSSQQFASTPRFSFSSSAVKQTATPSSAGQQPSTQFSSPLHLRSRPARIKDEDEIEDAPAVVTEGEPQADETAVGKGHHSLRGIEGIEIDSPPPPTSPSSPVRKRPRVEKSPELEEIVVSSSESPSSSPSPSPSPSRRQTSPTRRSQSPTSTHRFESSPPLSPQPNIHHANTNTTTSNRFILSPSHLPLPSIPTRPQFSLPPPRSPSPPPSLLTDSAIFSPHRKGGPKFLAGGMAAMVRGWVVGVATSSASGSKTAVGGEGGWERKVRAGDVLGGGEGEGGGRVVLVQGQGVNVDGEEGEKEGERWIFVGCGGGDVRKGEVVGVRGPVWDVELQGKDKGERWKVGVEWGLVDG